MKSLLSSLFLLVALCGVLPVKGDTPKGPEWLSKAVFYQIYPSSFMDSDGNGIGDLPGIISKLDYIKSLGVNAIWLNPIFKSGWFDGGYDVIDFYLVDPRFGTNSDAVRLIDEAHKRGMKVCFDLVAGHTSNQCEWFRQSMQADHNLRYSDYYIWTDSISEKERQLIIQRHQSAHPEVDGRGSFVEANAPRAKYFRKNFFEVQPALNYGYGKPDPSQPWQQPVTAPGPQAVRREMRNIMSFWFDKGVDGFRVDMASSLIKNDPGYVEVKKLWREMRTWMDEHYPDHVLISEWSHPDRAIPAGFNVDFMIHFGIKGYPSLFFNYDTQGGRGKGHCYFDPEGKGSLKEFIDNYQRVYDMTCHQGYITLPTSNHDFQRPNAGSRNTPEQLKVAMAFFLTMPGVPFIYYGDEIGMRFQEGLPSKEGSNERSGTRTPMQWTPGPTAGFSTCSPEKLYLPVYTENGRLTVSAEEKDKNSMLNFTRQLISLRQHTPALGNDGSWQLVSQVDQPYPMAYTRSDGQATYLVVLNPTEKAVSASLPAVKTNRPEQVMASGKVSLRSGKVTKVSLGKFSAAVFKL